MGQIGLPCTPPSPGQFETKFFALWTSPISKVDAIKKRWERLPGLGYFQNVRHQNLEITFCAITWVLRQLSHKIGGYTYVFGDEEFNYANKKCFCLVEKFINSYSNVFFVHFRSFFVLVHGSQRVTPMKIWDQVLLLIRPPLISKVDAIK